MRNDKVIDYETKLNRLEKQCNALKKDQDFTSDSSRQVHINYQLQELKKEQEATKHSLIQYQKRRAYSFFHKQSYTEAQKVWEWLLKYSHISENEYRVESQKITSKDNQAQQNKKTLEQLSLFYKSLKPIWKDLAYHLNNQTSKTQQVVYQAQQLINQEIDIEDFYILYETLIEQTTEQTNNTSQLIEISQNILSGKVALFIGSNIPHHYGNCETEDEIAKTLANKYNIDAPDSLSIIADYYQTKSGGKADLIQKIQQQITSQLDIPLYQQLAKASAQQVIVSTAYDDLLEQAFKTQQKQYVKLIPSLIETHEHEIGQLLIEYSDRNDKPIPIDPDELTLLAPLEKGYSIIYKMRGTCSSNTPPIENTLLLSERQFFDFSRFADKIIPQHLAHIFQKRDLLFLGFQPTRWEERLLVRALLSLRRHSGELSHVASKHQPPLLQAYWSHHHVQPYSFDIKDFEQAFEHLLSEPEEALL